MTAEGGPAEGDPGYPPPPRPPPAASPPQWSPPPGLDYGQPDYSGIQPHYGEPVGGGPGVLGLASWGQRLGALLLDQVFFGAAYLGVFIVAGLLGALLGVVDETLGQVLGVTVGAIGILLLVVWVLILEAGPYGQTPGKMVLRIRVLHANGQTISRGRSVGRQFAKALSAMPFYLGYLWPLWDTQRRTFHDMIVETRVVVVSDSPGLAAILKGPFQRQR